MRRGGGEGERRQSVQWRVKKGRNKAEAVVDPEEIRRARKKGYSTTSGARE